jgi:hypothetical protein
VQANHSQFVVELEEIEHQPVARQVEERVNAVIQHVCVDQARPVQVVQGLIEECTIIRARTQVVGESSAGGWNNRAECELLFKVALRIGRLAANRRHLKQTLVDLW